MITLPAVFDLADSFGVLIFEMMWKSTVILGSVILLGKLLRRQSASFKRAVYSTGILTMLCFMVIAPISPRWTLNNPDWLSVFGNEKASHNQMAIEPDSPEFQSQDGRLGIKSDSGNKLGRDRVFSLTITVFTFVWLTLALFLLGKLIANLFRLKRLRQSSSLETDGSINRLMQEIAGKAGCEKQSVTILRSETIEMPVTWGIFRHFILIPKGFEELPAENYRFILIHELAHIKRLDFVNRIFAEFLCAILWFQPLAWTARKSLKEAQERAADDRVLEMGEKASGYAKLLLECNDRLLGTGFSVVPGVVEQKGLKSRLEAILNPETRCRPITTPEVLFICLIIFSLAIPLIGLGISKEAKPVATGVPIESSNLADGSQTQANKSGASDLAQRAKVSKEKAIEIATNFQPGTVIQSEFGENDEGLIYKILIRNKDATKGEVTGLTINALDGRIIKAWRGIRK